MIDSISSRFTGDGTSSYVVRTDYPQNDPPNPKASHYVLNYRDGNFMYDTEVRALIELLKSALGD